MIIMDERISWQCYFFGLGMPSLHGIGKKSKARPMIFEVLQSKGTSHKLKYSQGH